jgi:tripartite-type tricarboxylate transporter receptor subunit TctC
VATLAEQGIQNADIYAWNSLVVPASTPEPIVQRLEAEVRRALTDPTLIERFRGLSLETNPFGTAEMAALWRQELATWPPLIRELGITLDN